MSDNPIPSIGRIVHYTLSESDVATIKESRKGRYCGNDVEVGQVYPAVIVRVWGDQPTSACNLTVLLDGHDTYWATSRSAGPGPMHFTWPQRG
jgi:hypothetical protein